MRMSRAGLGLLLAVALLAGSACVIDPSKSERSLGQLLTREDELAIGRDEHPRVLRQFGGEYRDLVLAGYVDQIGQSLAKLSDAPDVTFSFTVLNSPIVNAFALPGGYVYVTRGLLALAGNEAELASVLAHEIGHITARHAAQRHQRAQQKPAAASTTGVGELAPGQDPAAYVQGYSREQEMEADTLGIRYLARAGYDPAAMSTFLARLDAQARLEAALMGLPSDQADQMSFTATHPRTIDRVQAAQLRAGELGATPRAIDPEAYLKRIDGILYGDDPEQGFVRSTSFLHPRLLFRFDVPAGFRLFNSAQRVIARNPQEALILFDSARRPPGMSIADYLTGQWSRDLSLAGMERITINGLAAATGWTRVETNRGPRDLRLVAIQFDEQTTYRFTFITPPTLSDSLSLDLRRTTYSFRALTRDEGAILRPLRLQLHRVREGDTVAALAAKLPLPDGREETLRVLNGLARQDDLKPDQLIKVIVE
jgi:predicted Zn-dependent protease